MMPRLPLVHRTIAFALLVLVAASGCAHEQVTTVGPAASSDLLLPRIGASSTPTLLQCSAPATPGTASSVIGLLGGTLQVGNTKVVIPENAVLSPTTFTLTVPQSPLVEISVRAGTAEHYTFAQPVLVSIDYSRCAGQLSPLSPVTAWHIDESSKALLENMGGVDLRLLGTITFFTGHLSGYAVAD